MFATVLVSLFLYLLPPFLMSKLKVKKDIELLTGLSHKILRLVVKKGNDFFVILTSNDLKGQRSL